jgi:hypothetical protein
MNITQIEDNLKELVTKTSTSAESQSSFIYDLLLSYGHWPQSVGRLRSGERNLAKDPNEVLWKRHVYFRHSTDNQLHSQIDRMAKEKFVKNYKVRFVVVTDFQQFLAFDTKTGDSLDIEFSQLGKHFDFFLPWANMEKAVYQGENPADVKAAEKMATLFDLIKDENFDESAEEDLEKLHNLNVFLTRLLFCFFAEDTGIFEDNQFSRAIASHTKLDGSDLSDYLDRLFEVLDTDGCNRSDLPDFLQRFPYVNGGLFAERLPSPSFSKKSRKILIQCGNELDWSDINPDIFGSMIQAVVHTEQRGSMGMHYTSVPNIMKVIEPLFLNGFYEELERNQDNPRKLEKLLQRLAEVKIFDPACGSGNFLIIAYKELRRLEMEVFKRLQEIELEKIDTSKGEMAQLRVPLSGIKLSQFYGIELDDFAHEVAILSLWLAEHQMNQEFKAEFGDCAPSLPLQRSGNIVAENAVRIDWNTVCPASGEIYILGNPPYLGARLQDDSQKEDLKIAFKGFKNYKNLDYISCWFYKASIYINNINARFAFVSTNSVCQGEQVSLLWPSLLEDNKEIFFAHTDFLWSNNAKNKATVVCVIVGVRNQNDKSPKYIYSNGIKQLADNINSYLIDNQDVFVSRRSKVLNEYMPAMPKGNMPYDGGNLLFSKDEYFNFINDNEGSSSFFKKITGAKEFVQGIERYCLWITDDRLEEAKAIPAILERINKTKETRLSSSDKGAHKLASRPHQFREIQETTTSSLVIPSVTSERREYIPIGFIDSNTIVSNLAFVIYDTQAFMLSILSSKMHMAWVKAVSGRLNSRYRYSSALSYNTFPIPKLSDSDIEKLNESAFEILEARELYPDKTLAQLYDPDLMPSELKNAHQSNDDLVDKVFSNNPIKNDNDRLSILFNLYIKELSDA